MQVTWLPWSVDAFSRAQAERKPVLLCITAPWSQSCREMDRTSYADPAIAFEINDRFIPVRVNAERRPDICDRYSLGGWPTTAFLTPEGQMLGGGTYVTPARMSSVLAQVRDASKRVHDTGAGIAPATLVEQVRPAVDVTPDFLSRIVFDSYDDEHGGFGAAPKFPHAAPIHLALLHARSGQPAADDYLSIVTRTLDAMGWGPLYDDVDGGFFRCAAARDWRQPQREKMLSINASLLRVYVEAADVLKIARFGERAADTVDYVHRCLADAVDGGWYGSQHAEDGAVDTTFYTDANAEMASAMLRASAMFGDETLRDFALKSLERVLLASYRPGGGVAHYHDGQAHVRGLLVDQIAMAEAQLEAFEATGNIVYEMMAEELAFYAIREMWDAERGGFFDRAAVDDGDAVGLMRVRLKPFVTNCNAARMLTRLAATSGNHECAERARETLAATAPAAADQGPLAAHYVLAMKGIQQ